MLFDVFSNKVEFWGFWILDWGDVLLSKEESWWMLFDVFSNKVGFWGLWGAGFGDFGLGIADCGFLRAVVGISREGTGGGVTGEVFWMLFDVLSNKAGLFSMLFDVFPNKFDF